MSALRCFLAASMLVAALCVAACSSDGGARSASSSSDASSSSNQSWTAGEPVHGDVAVTWKNLDPKYPVATASLVNESSAAGQKLRSGKATSSEIRVMSDADMGGLLATLKDLGFFTYATDGIGLGNIPDLPGRKGVLIVTQDGHSKGLMLTLNMGMSPIPKAYSNSKKVVLAVHSQLQGYDIRVSTGAPDENTFSAPPIKIRKQ